MANTNMISSNHNNNSNNNSTAYTYNNYNSVSADSGNSSGSNGGSGGGNGSEVQTLREVCNMLNSAGATSNYMIPTGGCAYDHIIAMMRGLNLQDDGIILNNKIKAIETDFCNIVRDESMLWYVYVHICMYVVFK